MFNYLTGKHFVLVMMLFCLGICNVSKIFALKLDYFCGVSAVLLVTGNMSELD
jgi:hypothetical protein